MLETIQEIAVYLILALLCGIGAYIIKLKKQQLLNIITDLCQKAEDTIQGSGLGSEKKALVIAQLEAAGIKVTTAVSAAIDTIVAYLNTKSAWFASSASISASTVVGTATEAITTAVTDTTTS